MQCFAMLRFDFRPAIRGDGRVGKARLGEREATPAICMLPMCCPCAGRDAVDCGDRLAQLRAAHV